MQAMLDGNAKVGDVFIEDRSYDVKLVSTTNPDQRPDRSRKHLPEDPSDGRFVPMSTIATLSERRCRRRCRASSSSARWRSPPACAATSRSATRYAVAQEIAAPLLPPGARIMPLAEAATLGETNVGGCW
jgi:HAE1 family hydrophobic/amphiphilic exporter-1